LKTQHYNSVFLENKNGKAKTINLVANKALGPMARSIVQNWFKGRSEV
jgi:cytoplasmic iron level regulating protein YaaA (DUF328/UPF0246 family)